MKFEKENIKLSEDEGANYVMIDNEDFLLSSLNDGYKFSKGSSANLFILSDPTAETEDRVIKICKSPIPLSKHKRKDKRLQRFEREIKAFRMVKENNLSGIIEYYRAAIIEIGGSKFRCLIMEKADGDLPAFMEDHKFNFTTNQKLSFCVSILTGIKQLHNIGIYHRDIKHDNILLVGKEFKIGDLGLVAFQDADFELEQPNEKIGPFGWLSPEATNKMLTMDKKMMYKYDCQIDTNSDIFQLGKLFWYVFQGNLPIGQIRSDDCQIEDQDIFDIISSMLQYSKKRRPSISDLEALLEPLKIKYAV